MSPPQVEDQVKGRGQSDPAGGFGPLQASPEEFLTRLLAAQCRTAPAHAGAMVRIAAAGKVEIVAAFPAVPRDAGAPPWITQSAETIQQVIAAGRPGASPLRTGMVSFGSEPQHHLIVMPLKTEAGARGATVYHVQAPDNRTLNEIRERIELSMSLLALHDARTALERRNADISRLHASMELLAGINEQHRSVAAAMSFCNLVASKWSADRVSLGFLRGRYVRMAAMSHTEKFTRKTTQVQDVEAAMEECIDQDVEILHPASPEATTVTRLTAQLSEKHGPSSIVSLPLRYQGKPVGVVTVERPAAKPLTLDEIETLRLAVDLCAARLWDLHEHDKWIGAKIVTSTRKGLAALVGPKHTWAKAAALGLLLAVIILTLIPAPDRVEATFVIEGGDRRPITAPFDGKLVVLEKGLDAGVHVQAGDTLAVMETKPLLDQRAVAYKELEHATAEANIALQQNKTADQEMARKRAEKAEAQIRFLTNQIEEATIKAPISGVIVAAEREPRQLEGATVKIGAVLFEIVQVDRFKADLKIPEDRIADIGKAKGGELASTSHPGTYLPFTIEQVSPVGEVINQHNVFRVRVALTDTSHAAWLKPGMEGVAKIEVGKSRYLHLWTRGLINWVRMKLWI